MGIFDDLRFKKKGGAEGGLTQSALPIASTFDTRVTDARRLNDQRQITNTDSRSFATTNSFTDARNIQITMDSPDSQQTAPVLKKAQATSAESIPNIEPGQGADLSGSSGSGGGGLPIVPISLIAGAALVGVAFFGGIK